MKNKDAPQRGDYIYSSWGLVRNVESGVFNEVINEVLNLSLGHGWWGGSVGKGTDCQG